MKIIKTIENKQDMYLCLLNFCNFFLANLPKKIFAGQFSAGLLSG